MDRRKAGYILLLMLGLSGLTLPVSASTGNPISDFANNLLLIVPPVLFVMSMLALRKADYDYAFTLLLASIIVTVALAGFTGNVNSYGLLFYNLRVELYGTQSTSQYSQVSYNAVVSPLPSGWNVYKTEYEWLIYYNSSILVYNSSSGYVNGQYISGVSSSTYSLSFKPTKLGTYLISYSILYIANASGITGYASGGAGILLQVNSPPSPWDWITSAVVNALSSFVATLTGSVISAMTFITQAMFDVLSYGLILPVPSGTCALVVQNIYSELLQISIGLSLLFLAGTVAYNALRNQYTDIIDIARDLLYKIGVWLFFTFGGLEIYNYVATFIDNLIYEIINPYLPLVIMEISGATAFWAGLMFLDGMLGFGFASDFANFLGDFAYGMLVFTVFIIIRYFVILAIISLIPLLATLWIFEWTRKIADALIDILIGLAFAGLINTLVLTFIIGTDLGFLLILILPLIADGGTIISMILSIISMKPHERINFSSGRGGGSGGQQLQPPNQPQSPSPSTVVIQPQNVVIQTSNTAYQQKQPSGSPTTYI